MKNILLIIIVLISVETYCQEQQNQIKDTHQEGEIYYFDMNKHSCGQKYYIKMGSDTILVNRKSMDLKIGFKELPLKVYLTISGEENNSSCVGNYKTLSFIKIK